MNLLATGAWSCTEEQLNSLKSLGHNVSFLQQETDELPCDYNWVEGVVCNGLFLHHDISKFSNLKYIQATSAGLDRIPLDYCEQHNIVVKNARGVYSIPMAEFAISGVLDLYKKKKLFFEHQKEHKWIKERNLFELYGKTVLIVGCGSVGIECAKRFKAFGCATIGMDIFAVESELFDELYNISDLQTIVSKADVLVLTLPLTDETRNLINADILLQTKKTAIIVNISRGPIIDTHALIKALDKEAIGGAVLDVFEDEPLANDSCLWDYDNVVISPHNSFVSNKNNNRLFELIKRNLNEIL